MQNFSFTKKSSENIVCEMAAILSRGDGLITPLTFLLFHILMPYNVILYFRLPYFHVSNSPFFLHSTSVLSFYIDVVLTLFAGQDNQWINAVWMQTFNDKMSVVSKPSHTSCAPSNVMMYEQITLRLFGTEYIFCYCFAFHSNPLKFIPFGHQVVNPLPKPKSPETIGATYAS